MDAEDAERLQHADVLGPRRRPSGSWALPLRLRLMSKPLSRTPRPKSWMICAPSLLPTFIRPIVLTRQLFQPSVNFFEPISRLTVECGLLISWKSEPANSRSPRGEAVLLAELHQLGVVADVDDAERLRCRPSRSATSPVAPFRFSTYSWPPPGALKSVASVSSNTCAA